MSSLHAISLALLLLAEIIPAYSPDERAVVGAKPNRDAVMKGRWNRSAPLVPPSKHGHWLDQGEAFEDGWVRARFDEPWPEVVLLIRARIVKGKLEGLGLELQGRRVRFVAFRRGKRRALMPFKRLRPRIGMKRLEIVALALKGTAVLSAFDADDGTWLGTLGTTKAPKHAGHPGLSAVKRGQGALRHLSAWPACQLPLHAPEDAPPLVLTFTEPPKAQATLTWLERVQDEDFWRTDLVGLERLFCEGAPPPRRFITELPWKYLDLNYLKLRDRPPLRTADGFKLNDSYKDPQMISDLLAAYQARFPKQTRLEQIGESRQGVPIWAIGVADDIQAHDPRPAFLLNSGHHGSEILAPEFTLDALDHLLAKRDAFAKRLMREAVVWCVPLVNPDGLQAFLDISAALGRKSHHDVNGDGVIGRLEGVDLNRNYPFKWGALGERGSRSSRGSVYYRGPEAGSEPEVRAMMKLARRERFAAGISYHTGTVGVLAPYTIPGVANPEPNEAWTIAEAIAEHLGDHPVDDRTYRVRRNLYPVDGTDQDWHRHAHGTLALLIEGARWAPLEMPKRDLIVDHLRPAWRILFERFLDGPSLSIRVVDKTGAPVKAIVELEEVELSEGERWGTRCPQGDAHRYLHAPGTYTVKIKVGGAKPVERRVEVKGRASLEVTLPYKVRRRHCPKIKPPRAPKLK